MDVGLAFNPANKSGHPVIASLNNYTNSATPKALAAATMNNGWTAVGTQTMYCTDCHDTDSTASLGPHGSSVKWMLAGLNKAWPFTTTAGNGTSSGTTWKLGNYSTGTAPDKLFCLNCHTINNTNWAHQNLSSRHSASGTYGACVSCHIRIPHGGKVARLLRTDNTPARLLPDGNGGDVSGQSIQMFSSIKKANPYTNSPGFNDAGCGMHSTSGAETW